MGGVVLGDKWIWCIMEIWNYKKILVMKNGNKMNNYMGGVPC